MPQRPHNYLYLFWTPIHPLLYEVFVFTFSLLPEFKLSTESKFYSSLASPLVHVDGQWIWNEIISVKPSVQLLAQGMLHQCWLRILVNTQRRHSSLPPRGQVQPVRPARWILRACVTCDSLFLASWASSHLSRCSVFSGPPGFSWAMDWQLLGQAHSFPSHVSTEVFLSACHRRLLGCL